MGKKRALYIGINSYEHHADLRAASRDARAMAKSLEFDTSDSENPPKNWPATGKALLVSDSPKSSVTMSNLLDGVDTLFNSAVGDDVLFYFAGHGFETDSGLLLATSEDDSELTRAGITLNELLIRVSRSRANSATIILDCCQAGLATSVDLPRNVAIIAGAGADQEAAEFGGRGQFTRFLLDGLRGGAADTLGVVTALSLFTYAAGALSYLKGQEPVIKANIDQLVELKRVPGKASLKDLRLLAPKDGQPGMFNSKEARNGVTPDHEATQAQNTPPMRSRPYPMTEPLTPKQQDMDYYKRLRNAGLLETVGRGDLFWACMNNGEVRLTPLGQYYWDLADQGLI